MMYARLRLLLFQIGIVLQVICLSPVLARAEEVQTVSPAAPAFDAASSGYLTLRKHKWHCAHCVLKYADFSHFSSLSPPPPLQKNCQQDLVLKGADLAAANFNHAGFQACQRGVQTPFKRIVFDGADLKAATFAESVFYGVSFIYANLAGARLDGAKLGLCDFTSANFSHASLMHAQSWRDAMHGWGSVFRMANFCSANLKGAHLYGNFRGANFHHANLSGAVLTSGQDALAYHDSGRDFQKPGALWAGVNFEGANLTGARICDADYRTADGSDTAHACNASPGIHADLSLAIFCHTIMPDGHINNRNCA